MKAPIPWDLFDVVLHQNTLDFPAERRLNEWIEDVKVWGTYISPFLLLSVCEAAAYRSFPDESLGRRASYAFFLAWTLYKAGLCVLSSSDLDAADVNGGVLSTSNRQDEVCFGESISLSFPPDFPLSAHVVEGHPSLMALTSSSPLLLGMWMHNVNECPSAIPCIRAVSCDPCGRYVIVERLVASLEEFFWENDGCVTAHDTALLAKIADVGEVLLSLSHTVDLELDHLFLTHEFEIRTIAPLQESYPFFCLTVVEQFLREVCHEDQERLRLLFHRMGLWRHPAALMYRSLIEKFSFNVTGPDIHRELMVFEIDDQNFLYVSDWIRILRRHVSHIRQLQSSVPQFVALPPREQTARIVAAVVRSQEEIGWVSYVPPTLSEHVDSWMRLRFKPRTEVSFL
jgi:hypothetical protein